MSIKVKHSLDELFLELDIFAHKNISFHHHLRNGDQTINQVLSYYIKNKVTDLHLFPSSIFPSYTSIKTLLENNQIAHITTNYMNGEVADFISSKVNQNMITMQTHGGRARAIIEGDSPIDIAFIATPYVSHKGNGTGIIGKNKCGSLGYAIPDSEYAKITVLITDTYEELEPDIIEIKSSNVDYVVLVDSIGDNKGIISGTTNITTNPIGVKIAKYATNLLEELEVIKNGFSFQSGAGGTSLLVTKHVEDIMRKNHIKASFFSGGITKYHVSMLENNLVEKLYDVQCFDLEAVNSLSRNRNHIPISASTYANPNDPNQVIKDLDVVILGATEIDLNFNVNVTTSSHNTIIGGSGGHSDTASEAKYTIIVSPLIKGRLPIVKEKVTTITTKGEHIDIFVTERGIAINPRRQDIIDKLQNSKLKIYTIEELMNLAHSYTNTPKNIKKSDTIIGVVEDRDKQIIDYLYQK